MKLNSLQKKVDDWIKKYGVRYFDELTNMAQLTEEVGEVARIISRKYGEQTSKKGESASATARKYQGGIYRGRFDGGREQGRKRLHLPDG